MGKPRRSQHVAECQWDVDGRGRCNPVSTPIFPERPGLDRLILKLYRARPGIVDYHPHRQQQRIWNSDRGIGFVPNLRLSLLY